MAIVKMRRLRLFGMAADKALLLEQLQDLGCVEVSDAAPRLKEAAWSSLTKVDEDALPALQSDAAAVNAAIATLKRAVKEKGALLRPRPEISRAKLFDDATRAEALAAAHIVGENEKQISSIYSERSKLSAQKLALAPWLGIPLPLETAETDEMSVLLGAVALAAPMDELRAALLEVSPLWELTVAGCDREFQYLMLLCHKSAEEALLEILKRYAFTRSALRGLTGTAQENTDALLGQSLALDAQLALAHKSIAAEAVHRDALRLCSDRLAQEIQREQVKGRLVHSESTIFLEGWVPVPQLPALEALLGGFICCWQSEDPTPEQYPDVPVQLKSNLLTRPLNMVTEMYSLPAYDGVDPNPLIMPFFVFFFGFMFADLGYGLILAGVSAFVTLRLKPKGGTGYLFALMIECGIASAVIGFFTGGFFADAIKTFAGLLGLAVPQIPFLTVHPVFDIMTQPMEVLVLTLGIGLVQIVFGMGVNAYMLIRDGKWFDALCDVGTWYLVFIGIAVVALTGSWYVMYAAFAAIILTQGRHGKGIVGKAVGILASLYNNVTGYFGDVLSYSRLMVMMLAGSVIGQIFNLLGAMPGNMFIFLPIFIVGHIFNMGLNVIGTYVHTSRLQYLEFFGKFYKEGGRAFRPLTLATQYVDIIKEEQ